MNFDDRLRSALTHDPLPVVPPGFVDDIVDALPRARGGPAQRVRALGFTVAVVIAVSVGVWVVGPSGWLVGPAASPTSGTGTASAPASASPTEATPGLGAWTHLAWQDVSPAFGGSSGPIVTGTSSSGGYVLVGGNGFPGSTIWYSADGLAWRRGVESDGGEFQGMSFVGVAAGGGNLVAIAQLEGALTPTRVRPTLVWHSTDGVVWFPSPEPPTCLGDSRFMGSPAAPTGSSSMARTCPVNRCVQRCCTPMTVSRGRKPRSPTAWSDKPSPRSSRRWKASPPSADRPQAPLAVVRLGGLRTVRRGSRPPSNPRSDWSTSFDGPVVSSGHRAAIGRRVRCASVSPGPSRGHPPTAGEAGGRSATARCSRTAIRRSTTRGGWSAFKRRAVRGPRGAPMV